MSDRSLMDQVDKGIDALLADTESEPQVSDPVVDDLLALAARLRTMPRETFKARLQADLLGTVNQYATRHQPVASGSIAASQILIPSDILPTLTHPGQSWYPAHRGSFMASFGAHALMIALLVTSGIWAANLAEKPSVSSLMVTDIGSYVFPPATDQTGGGGGGGDSSKSAPSKGNPPRFAGEQIVPPAIVVRSAPPRLAAEPTVVGPPALSFPQTAQLGDPLSSASLPSNGPGRSGGIGSGDHGGVGPGEGRGVGEGSWAGIGGGPYVVGRGVSAPQLLYDPEPEYSDEARKQKYQGVVVLRVIVGEDGRPRDIRVAQSLGLGLDEKAQDAVRTWRFDPGRLNGQAVAVVANVQVNFRLY